MNKIQEINKIGGARIGKQNATYPFAKLFVDKNDLSLSVAIIGNFNFKKEDIITIEEYNIIPVLGQGIRIFHRNSSYNSKIVFWTTENPTNLINQIKQIGFLNQLDSKLTEDDLTEIHNQKLKEFPLNPLVFVVLFFLTFSIFVNSFLFFPFQDGGIEIILRAILVLSGTISITTILTLVSKSIQNIIIVKYRSFEYVKKYFMTIAIITSLIFFTLLFITNFTDY